MAILSLITMSPWLAAFGVYYLILSLMRGAVLWSKKNHIKKEENTYLGVAISLLVLTLITAMIIAFTHGFAIIAEFEEFIIYGAAIYTCYKLVLSIYSIIKAKRQDSLLVEAIKDISFVDALVSIFVLQVTMIQSLVSDGAYNMLVLNGITGCIVCCGIIAVAMLMIIKVFKVKKQRKNKEDLLK